MRKLFTKSIVLVALLIFATSTVMATSKYATVTGNWSTVTWYDAATAGNATTIPTASDDVFINDGVTVTIDQAVSVASLTIGQGTSGVLTFDGTAIRAVVVTGNITVATGGTFIVQATGSYANTLSVGGHITNNGTFDMSRNSSTTVCNVTFNGTGEQDLSGTSPVLTRFRGITLTKSSASDKVKSTIDAYFGGSALLLLTTGTWEQNVGNLINTSGNQTLGSSNGVLLIDGTGGYTNYNTTNLNASLGASLAVSAGTFTVNTTGTVRIGCGNNSVTCITPGVVNLTSGTVQIFGRLTLTTGTSTINGANIFIDPNPSFTGASALSGGSNAFEVSGAGGTFNFTSGSVTLVNPTNAATTGRDLKITSTGTVNITNGIIYLGDGVSTTVSAASTTYNGFVNGSSWVIPNLVLRTGGLSGRNFGLKVNMTVGKLTMISGTIESISSTTVTYSTGGTLTYNGAAAQTSTDVEFPATSGPANLTINNATGVNLHAVRTVSGALTLTSGALSLGANNLTVGSAGSISGGSSSSYIATNGGGNLIQTLAATTAKLFPIGASATSYDPVTLTPTTATDVAVNVGTTLPAAAPSNYTYNSKVWNITPVTPSSTDVTLTPSSAVTTANRDVVAQYVTDSYVNSVATKSGNAYTATFTTFSPFVTGTTDLGTALAQTTIAGVAFDGQTIHNTSNVDLQVFDIAGRKVYGSNKDINMISNTKGIYFVKSNTGMLKIILTK
jgi:hypothetical protein